jgi:nitroreductase
MSFLDLAKQRYSTRLYQAKPVSKEDLELILEAARVAPTGANRQPFRLIVIQDAKALAKVAQGANTFNAPLVIITCANHHESWKRSFDGKDIADIDASIVTTHMMLQAAELGLGSVWICKFDPAAIREACQIPEHIEPVNILSIGYEAGTPKSPDRHATQRRPIEEFVINETF